MKPGELIAGKGSIPCNQGRRTAAVQVENTSDHIIYVASHYHFFEANKRLRFDRRSGYGMHLDIPAGTSVRWDPGEVREVRLTEYAGRRRVYGYQGFVNGPLTTPETSLALARERGFLDTGA